MLHPSPLTQTAHLHRVASVILFIVVTLMVRDVSFIFLIVLSIEFRIFIYALIDDSNYVTFEHIINERLLVKQPLVKHRFHYYLDQLLEFLICPPLH